MSSAETFACDISWLASAHRAFALAALVATVPAPAQAQEETQSDLRTVVEDFAPGWEVRWRPVPLGRSPTVYEVVDDAGETVLRAASDDAASALIRPLQLDGSQASTIAWRWRVERSLRGNARERERAGDDYAARLFVVFGSRGTLEDALCYVWASTEPAGSVYRSPYVSSVATIVLRSGDADAGDWVSEERDIRADYRSFFGGDPGPPTAIAIMVDTDDTEATARAWFDDILLVVREGRSPRR